MGPRLRKAVTAGLLTPGAVYQRAQQVRRLYVREMAELLDSVALLVTPPAPTPAPQGLHHTGSAHFNSPFTLTGFPSMNVPCGFATDTGLPLGVQLVAGPWREQTLLRVASVYQTVTDWHRREPQL